MKIILKYILANVKESKTRAIIMMLSILLSTVLLFVSFSIGASYENAQRKMTRGIAGTATVSVSPKDVNLVVNLDLLFISISAVIAITVVGNFVNTYITDVFNGAELQGFADGEMNYGFVQKIKKMDGIGKVLPVYVFRDEMKCEGIVFSRLEATDNLEWYNSMLNLHYTKKGMESSAVFQFSKIRSIILSEECFKQAGFRIGDTVTLANGVGSNSYTIAGSFKSRATDVEAVIPSAYAVSDFGASNYNFLAYTAADPDSIMIQIRDLFGSTQNWSRT